MGGRWARAIYLNLKHAIGCLFRTPLVACCWGRCRHELDSVCVPCRRREEEADANMNLLGVIRWHRIVTCHIQCIPTYLTSCTSHSAHGIIPQRQTPSNPSSRTKVLPPKLSSCLEFRIGNEATDYLFVSLFPSTIRRLARQTLRLPTATSKSSTCRLVRTAPGSLAEGKEGSERRQGKPAFATPSCIARLREQYEYIMYSNDEGKPYKARRASVVI